jgi:hypothetical protein
MRHNRLTDMISPLRFHFMYFIKVMFVNLNKMLNCISLFVNVFTKLKVKYAFYI